MARGIFRIRNGDKRLIVLNASPLGGRSECRATTSIAAISTSAGPRAGRRSLSAIARSAGMLKPRLERAGLFVGLDIIGDYLTEVNVSSRTDAGDRSLDIPTSKRR